MRVYKYSVCACSITSVVDAQIIINHAAPASDTTPSSAFGVGGEHRSQASGDARRRATGRPGIYPCAPKVYRKRLHSQGDWGRSVSFDYPLFVCAQASRARRRGITRVQIARAPRPWRRARSVRFCLEEALIYFESHFTRTPYGAGWGRATPMWETRGSGGRVAIARTRHDACDRLDRITSPPPFSSTISQLDRGDNPGRLPCERPPAPAIYTYS